MHFAQRVRTNLTESSGERQSGQARCIVHDLVCDDEKTPFTNKGNGGLCQPMIIGEKSTPC